MRLTFCFIWLKCKRKSSTSLPKIRKYIRNQMVITLYFLICHLLHQIIILNIINIKLNCISSIFSIILKHLNDWKHFSRITNSHCFTQVKISKGLVFRHLLLKLFIFYINGREIDRKNEASLIKQCSSCIG